MTWSVSVIIPTYNSSSYVLQAVDSALGQTIQPSEVIVVDDGSTDDTAKVFSGSRRTVRYIYQENRGLSAARNRGIAEARGDLIAFLDADDVWLPEKLEKQTACLAQHPESGLVHSDLLYWDDRTGQTSRRECGRAAKAGRCYEQFLSRNGVTPSTVIVRRTCLARVGTFDEAIRRPTTQDYDLWFRIARHYELLYVEEPLVLYRQHESNASNQTVAMLEDELYVVRKALRADPSLSSLAGATIVNRRLFTLLFSLGYLHHDARRQAEACDCFRGALSYSPSHLYTWSLYLANLLPSPWLRQVRSLKSFVRLPRRV